MSYPSIISIDTGTTDPSVECFCQSNCFKNYHKLPWTSRLEALINQFKKKPTINWPYIWVIWKVKKIMLEDIVKKNNHWILWRQKSPHSIHRWEQDLNLKFVNFYIEPPLSNLVRQLLYSVIEFSMMNHLRGRLPIVWNIYRLNDFSKSHRTSKYRNLIDFIFRLQPLKKYLGFRATSFQIIQPHSYVFAIFFVLLPYGGIPYWQSCRCDWLGCCDVCWLTKPAITNTIRHWLALMKPAQTIIVEDRAEPPLFSISSSWDWLFNNSRS